MIEDFFEIETAQLNLIYGDCIDKMKKLPNNSIDTIITDPPYGLQFMGKKWDYNVPGIEIWQECLKVLKPGGTALVFAGSRTQHRMAINIEDAGFILKDTIMWLYGSGFPKATDISKNICKLFDKDYIVGINTGKKDSVTVDILKHEWNGWKSHGLKPAYEPIIIAMKPNDGTYVNNALIHGVSGLNIDDTRISTNENCGRLQKDGPCPPKYGFNNNKMGNKFQPGHKKGRYPANIILDEEASRILDKQKNNVSRFFYCAKASKKERGEGNTHPTIKPLKLMEYLCILTKTPTGGVVLDPFMGSGTTGLACKNIKRDFIGIEIDEKYFKIADKRIRNG
jgi:site-specific DNA-methyltransferase (adenine-specific)